MKYITKFKLNCPRSTLAGNYKYLLYKYKFSHLDFDLDIGNILSKIPLKTVNDSVTYTTRELCELRDHVKYTCEIVSPNMIHVLLDTLFIE